MALEACFQLSTIASSATSSAARASCLYSHRQKISSQIGGSKGAAFSLSSAQSSPFPPSFLSSQPRGHQVGFVCEAKNAVDGVIAVDDAGWDEAVAGSNNTLVLVDFWAPWCGPCRMIEPVINELARDYVGKVTCYKVNTDISPNIATKYGIRSIPTVLFFKDGEKKASIIGAVPKSEFIDTIGKYTLLKTISLPTFMMKGLDLSFDEQPFAVE